MEKQTEQQAKLDVEDAGQTKRVLKVEVPADEISQEFDRTYKAIQQKAVWPGFRQGRVPLQMIRKRMSKEAAEDLLQRMIPQYYAWAVEKADLKPVDMPIIRNVHIKEGESFRFDATVYVKPRFEVRDYKGVPVSKNEIEISEEIVDKVLLDVQNRFAELKSYEDETRAVAGGDVVEVDFEGFLDGKPIEETKGENHLIEVGAGRRLAGLEEGLRGMKKGETKEIKVTYPGDYYNPDLVGKEALFKVQVKDIKEKRLPALDDELAKDVGEKFETLKQLRAEIRQNIRAREEKKQREEMRLDVMDEVLRRNPIEEVPEVMVERRKRSFREDMEVHLQHMGRKPEEISHILAGEKMKIEEKARRDVAWELILDQIADKEGITVSGLELDDALGKAAAESSMTPQALRDFYVNQAGSLEPLRLSLLHEKTLDFLLENATVTHKSESGG